MVQPQSVCPTPATDIDESLAALGWRYGDPSRKIGEEMNEFPGPRDPADRLLNSFRREGFLPLRRGEFDPAGDGGSVTYGVKLGRESMGIERLRESRSED